MPIMPDPLPPPHPPAAGGRTGRVATLAACNLDQWAMDFAGNLARVKASVDRARAMGATYRLGPELEIPGYGCEDHFLELDTIEHSWEAVADLIATGYSDGILLDVGLPALHRGVCYNCRLFVLDRRVLLVRPKLHLADDGNYRERRYFAAWPHPRALERLPLPACVRAACASGGEGGDGGGDGDDGGAGGQRDAPFGHAVLRFERDGATLASETCEELFTPRAPHIDLALQGVEIVANGSGSHHQLRKLDERLDLVRGATRKGAGVYLYSNQRGCDGGRLYYDGCACVAANGELVAQGAQFGLREVEVVAATVDLDAVVARRQGASSLRGQAAATEGPEYVEVGGGFALCHGWEARGYRERAAARAREEAAAGGGAAEAAGTATATTATTTTTTTTTATTTTTTAKKAKPRLPPGVPPPVSPPIQPRVHLPEEEIAYGPAAWLWDYLRRSGAGGFLLPLSGGADSASVAAIVAAMCQMVARAVAEGDAGVIADAARIGRYDLSAGGFGGGDGGKGKGGGGGGGRGNGPATSNGGNNNGNNGSGSSSGRLALDPKEFASRVFTTVYMGSGASSSVETRARAETLASEVGSLHLCLDIDLAVAAALRIFTAATILLPGCGLPPRFRADGGSATENLALQNLQARLRMVLAFLLAQLVPWARRAPACLSGRATGSESGGAGGGAGGSGAPAPALPPPSFLLVLGASNVDEALRGYLTKYDCSAADVNPIGGVSKADLRRLLRWAAAALGLPSLAAVERAPPSAELEPLRPGQPPQTDEADMGCTYDDLGALGRLRKVARCGPVAAYRRLVAAWGWERRLEQEGEQGEEEKGAGAAGGDATTATAAAPPPPPPPALPPLEVARRVKHFFTHYAANRHKATVLPPSYHAESYSPDDNRFDHRQFLYNVRWPWQFARIDAEAKAAQAAWDADGGGAGDADADAGVAADR